MQATLNKLHFVNLDRQDLITDQIGEVFITDIFMEKKTYIKYYLTNNVAYLQKKPLVDNKTLACSKYWLKLLSRT